MTQQNDPEGRNLPPVVRDIIMEPEVKENSFWELIKFALLALLIVVPIRTFVAQPFIVSGSSMVPTFHDGQYLIVDELTYRFHEPERGDVIIFRYPKDPKKYFSRRIVGLPEETRVLQDHYTLIKNNEFPNGFALEEPFVKNTASNSLTVTLKKDEYFVMGDNRVASSDSRVWGTLPRKLIIGRAFLRLLPVTEAAILPGDYKQI